MAAGRFKDLIFRTLDEVARTKSAVVITKHGQPVAKLVPYSPATPARGLAGSVLRESDKGDPFSTAERWNTDPA